MTAASPKDSPSFVDPPDPAAVAKLVTSLDPSDLKAVGLFGVGAQTNFARFNRSYLEQIRSFDPQTAQSALANLLQVVQGIKLVGAAPRGLLGKIPGLGALLRDPEAEREQLLEQLQQVDQLTISLERAQFGLLRDLAVLEQMEAKSGEYLAELNLQLAAMEQIYAQSQDQGAAVIEATGKRLQDLQVAKTVALQAIPAMRIVWETSKLLADKIQSSILNTIPAWRNQVAVALGAGAQDDTQTKRSLAAASQVQAEIAASLENTLGMEQQMEGEQAAAAKTLSESEQRLQAALR